MAPSARANRRWADEEDDDNQLDRLRRPRRVRKYRSIVAIMRVARRVQLINEDDDDGFDQTVEIKKEENVDDGDGDDCYSKLGCQECGRGDNEEEILLCDKCDKGYHLDCLRPIVPRVPFGHWYCPSCSDHIRPSMALAKSLTQTSILDFFRIQKCSESMADFTSALDTRKRRKRSGPLVYHKKRRRLLPYIPTEDADLRLKQMGSLASALTAMNIEFSAELTYVRGMAPRSANQAKFEKGGMQVLCKENVETLEYCKLMEKSGLCPPLMVVFDSCEGYTVEADGPIKDLTLIAEYAGDVDYMKKRECDDCDSLMTLLSAKQPSRSLVVCPDKRGNIARFINGINNHLPESKKKQNLKCVRYDVDGKCRVLLVATRDIAKGERLYYDYNGHEHEYPTHHFI
ncbi:unnamed protein product [Coffea canephora]|uniref:[histone H3]-lysine(27) N-methyltransferase n=2 Tax=Coffea TaxID=13442 RepID=A0A068U991_COFCA|nr:probable Histone-lysine N-methyltransferase ATXR5 isoform X1 [Coffea arabica]CDP04739.1 unnamed protein product [Coffea canephora]